MEKNQADKIYAVLKWAAISSSLCDAWKDRNFGQNPEDDETPAPSTTSDSDQQSSTKTLKNRKASKPSRAKRNSNIETPAIKKVTQQPLSVTKAEKANPKKKNETPEISPRDETPRPKPKQRS